MAHIDLNPFWLTPAVRGESLFFIDNRSTLLFLPEGEVTLASSDGSVVYEEKRDFEVNTEEGFLRLTPKSRIANTLTSELYVPADSSSTDKYAHKRGNPDLWMLWNEKGLYASRQVLASYTRKNSWNGFIPEFAGSRLGRTLRKLRSKEVLKVAVSGDSISEGYNATLNLKQPPFQPPYAALFAQGLKTTYNAPVELRNFAVGGWTSAKGLADAGTRAASQPDLLIIAYGMNDQGFTPEQYGSNIQGILNAFRAVNPGLEAILVSSMLPNPEWKYPETNRFQEFRETLLALCGEGVALADMTRVWADLTRRKTHYDLTGNGLNHPNDFAHRLYAMTLLSLLVETERFTVL